MKMTFEKIKDLINCSRRIGLTYHVSPDGDAIGSLLALKFALQKLNKEVVVFSKDNLKNNTSLSFLPEIHKIDGNNYNVDKSIDLLIIVDCGNIERVSCNFDVHETETLGIDHHISNENYCKYNFINSKSSSTGEIIYEIIKHLGVDIDKDISTCIYTSIMTDTGGLRFECATQKTFDIVGDIVGSGLDFWNVYEKLFLVQPYSKIKLLSLIFDKLKIVDDRICIIKITEDMLNKSGSCDEHTSDIVSTGLTIEGVMVSVLIKSFQNKVKVSLRSKDYIDVCKIAQMFGGGGHIKAAAFITELTMDEIEQLLLKEIRNILL